jgi:hypothetical protein
MRPSKLARAATVSSLLLLVAAGTAAQAADETTSLSYVRIDLLDGRTLQDVLVKSYDASSGKLLVVTNGRAQLIPIRLLPPPIAARLKAVAPEGGSTTAVVTQTTMPPEKEDSAVSKSIPEIAPVPAIAALDPSSPAEIEKLLNLHQKVAEKWVTNYYQFEFHAGSSSISVTVLNFDLDDPKPIDGWTGRYRTEGKAFLEYYDSKGRSFQRTTSCFEVITEQKNGVGKPKVVDFVRK